MKWLLYSYIILVIILHLIPTPGGLEISSAEVGFIRMDYLLHVLVFLPWMFFSLTFRHNQTARKWSLHDPSVWFGLGILAATATEGIHYWLPYRSFNPVDMLANAAGVVIGAVVIFGGWWIAGKKRGYANFR